MFIWCNWLRVLVGVLRFSRGSHLIFSFSLYIVVIFKSRAVNFTLLCRSIGRFDHSAGLLELSNYEYVWMLYIAKVGNFFSQGDFRSSFRPSVCPEMANLKPAWVDLAAWNGWFVELEGRFEAWEDKFLAREGIFQACDIERQKVKERHKVIERQKVIEKQKVTDGDSGRQRMTEIEGGRDRPNARQRRLAGRG